MRSPLAPSPPNVLRVVGDRVTPVIVAAMGAGRYEVFDVTGPEGSGPPSHSHPWDEGYFILEGDLAVVDGSKGLDAPHELVLSPGGSAFIPGGATPSFQARGPACRSSSSRLPASSDSLPTPRRRFRASRTTWIL